MVDGKKVIDEKDFWCAWQINARVDDCSASSEFKEGELVTFCTAHLVEARVFPCRRRVNEVVYNPSDEYHSGLSILGDEDFKPLSGRERYLQKVVQEGS